MNPEISIIVPVYNAAELIESTLDSIFLQTFQNFELILIDDGSTDQTHEIIDSYRENLSKGQQGKLIYCYQENQGPSAARNHGMKAARGNYLAFIDSDDLIREDYLEILYKQVQGHTNDMAACGFEQFGSENKRLEKRNLKDWEVEFAPGHRHLFFYTMWGKLYSREYIEKYNLQLVVGETVEDLSFNIAAHLLTDRIAVLSECAYLYRVNPHSITHQQIRKKKSSPKFPYLGLREAVEKVLKERPEQKPLLEYVLVKALAGLVIDAGANCEKQTRKQLCAYCNQMIKQYAPRTSKNPYFKLNASKPLPLSHRLAVKLFVWAYRTKTMYAFSTLISMF